MSLSEQCITTGTSDVLEKITSKDYKVKIVKLCTEGVTYEIIDNNKFIEDLTTLSKAGIFSDIVDWHIMNVVSDDYMIIKTDLFEGWSMTKVEVILEKSSIDKKEME